MKVIWTPEAQKDREDIWEFIANENPFAATRMDELFREAAARLSEHSMLGKAGQIPGTRELFPHESYRMVYEIWRRHRMDIDARPCGTSVAARSRRLTFSAARRQRGRDCFTSTVWC